MALEGTLEELSIADLLEAFQEDRKSGLLSLDSGYERGVIYISEGRLIDAVLLRGPERNPVLDGQEAALKILRWASAAFVFEHDVQIARRPIRIDQDPHSLLDAAQDDTSRPAAASQQRRGETLISLAHLPENAAATIQLDLADWRFLAAVGTAGSTLSAVAQKLDFSADEATTLLQRLARCGLVQTSVKAAPSEPPARPAITGPQPEKILNLPPRRATSAPSNSLLKAIIRRIHTL